MKRAKNIVASATIMLALTFGSTFAHAGIIMSKGGERVSCSRTKGGIVNKIRGIILEGIILSKVGIIMSKEGIIMSKENSTPCDSKRTNEGIIIS